MGFLAVIAIMSLSSNSIYLDVFLSCMLHELGHMAMIILCRKRVCRVGFNAAGIKIFESSDRIGSALCENIILLGGPCANLLAAAAVAITAGADNRFVYLNLFLGIFNLLPFRCLDGGSIIVNILDIYAKGKYDTLLFIVKIINVCLLLFFCYFFSDAIVSNISAVIMIIYLIFSEILK
ncbi:MAG: hypothetical protein Q4F95_06085 [Oscillospiraceae bacterium]|nr:hypothetical protein [Oscillospiraceae bacterium]